MLKTVVSNTSKRTKNLQNRKKNNKSLQMFGRMEVMRQERNFKIGKEKLNKIRWNKFQKCYPILNLKKPLK